jgi:hypothetical protein
MRLAAALVVAVLLAGCGASEHTATSGHLHESADPFNQFVPHRGTATAHFGSGSDAHLVGPDGKPLTTTEAGAFIRRMEARCRAEHEPCNVLGGLELSTKRYKVQIK